MQVLKDMNGPDISSGIMTLIGLKDEDIIFVNYNLKQ